MFKRLLIANRGEIACRVIRTARRMGIGTIAVFSEADRRALHVEMADEAVLIGPAAVAESYLSIERIVAACRQTGAEAVHPGYGFLSEREDFPRALAKADITFIGPHPEAVAAMGDKIASKEAAARAGVSVVPGHLGIVGDARDAEAIAAAIGYPVMIKAAAGGGGKGMRIARDRIELADGLQRAKAEAAASFGDDRVFIEKFIRDPRHIEIQVLGDKHGHVIHLGERECSIQRRHQKVVEEAPSPLLDPATRQAMGEQAVALAKAVSYDSAGTVEFVVDQDKNFYFLEMNTRLQVEHPVTELVTGIDLVEEMIRIAAGEPLRLRQEDVRLDGWAVEARIYAEDPHRNFLPSIGRLTRYWPPAESSTGGITVRVDSGVAEGGGIPVYYDPMIAKLVTHAPTRSAAIAAQAQALDGFMVDGVRHNIPFLARLMTHPRWREARLSTGFIAEEFPSGFTRAVPTGETARRMAAVAAAIDRALEERRRRISGQQAARGPLGQVRRVVRLEATEIAVEVATEANGIAVTIGGKRRLLTSDWRPGAPLWQGYYDGEPLTMQVRPVLNGFDLTHGGFEARAWVYSEREAEAARLMPELPVSSSGRLLRCPMPGLVVAVPVEEGQAVAAGDALAIVEAMKMQNVLRAECAGVVKSIKTKPGDSLSVDQVILEFA